MQQDTRMGGKTLQYAFLRSLPVMAGYIVLGFGFGVLMVSRGFHWGWALLMSVAIYAGSMQYVAVDLLTGGATIITTALMTLMVNARHLFYGISMIERYQDTGKKKPYLIFALTDETYSLVCSGEVPEGVDQKNAFFWISLFDQCYWVLGSALGALLGSILPINFAGIEFSMTALFLVVMVDQYLATKSHASALIGLICSVACLLMFGPERFLLPAMVSITLALALGRRYLEEP